MELLKVAGIGPKTQEYLNKLNIYNSDDLIRYYPFRYNVYKVSDIMNSIEDETLIVVAKIVSTPKVSFIKRNFNRLSFTAECDGLLINVTIFNRAYLSKQLLINKKVTLIGKYNMLKNTFTASDIKLREINKVEIEPVYHLVNGISSSLMKKCISNVLNNTDYISSSIPSIYEEKYDLMNTLSSIKEIHNPTTTDNFKKAKLRLKYDELFEFMFKINLIKYKNRLQDNYVLKNIEYDKVEEIIKSLPFELTNDQILAIKDIYNDFNEYKRMNRLVLGDVGSGKTIISFVAIMINKLCGYQSAMLVPTEVLARQHYDNFTSLFKDIKVELLVGSLTKKEKEIIIDKLKNNEIDLLIGTHAILEENVEFANIGLVVTDEQHRFGVNQRKKLQNKGLMVDVLYMSATPIPRTYALTIYGDMDISLVKEKPKGRKEIITTLHKFDDKSYFNYIKEELNNNHQIYVVSPLIEENDESNLQDINKIKEEYENIFKDYNIDILHGKMKNVDKDKVINNFKSGITNILISTTVIEVGVDVKNSTVMVIYNAERFGLATLHQLRGRVGRNELQSRCMLISDYDSERLKVLCESNDGFYISEKDFELRGSGDLFGIRQSGDMSFKIADIQKDYKILLQCKKDTEEFILNNIENDFRDYKYYHDLSITYVDNS